MGMSKAAFKVNAPWDTAAVEGTAIGGPRT
jgi:hypothetical protein